jgi:hypothetical protein
MEAALPADDGSDFVLAKRGFVGSIPDADVPGAWSQRPFAFLEGERPDTVNPSLWRQARLNAHHGLFEVTPGVYQVRGFDLANISFIKGDTGWIVFDPLTAAETGHLVLATLHTASAPQAIDRLVDAFPAGEKEGVRNLFAECLVGVLAQTLCPHASGSGRVAAHEVMVGTTAVRKLIREGKVGQLYSQLQTGQSVGMQTLDQSLLSLWRQQKISPATLQELSKYPQNLNLMENIPAERLTLS